MARLDEADEEHREDNGKEKPEREHVGISLKPRLEEPARGMMILPGGERASAEQQAARLFHEAPALRHVSRRMRLPGYRIPRGNLLFQGFLA
ncbi:MAG TPA: hypothetical protein VM186_06025 [Planctomycetota bacterium]|nr:hypothetical protein [Planctomycetota bacterium]